MHEVQTFSISEDDAPKWGTLYQVTIYVHSAIKCFITGKYFRISVVAVLSSTGSIDSLYHILHVESQLLVSISAQKGASTTSAPMFGNGSGVNLLIEFLNDRSPFVFTYNNKNTAECIECVGKGYILD